MVVQSNVPAINAHRNLGINNSALSKNLEKLSSGYKINRAGDDAAGLAISEKMRSQIRGLEMAEQNTENAVSLIQTAEGGLNETHAILQRMRELAVQSSNGTYTNEDRAQITLEYEALKSEITRIADSTHYNGINLLDGSLTNGNYIKDFSGNSLADVELSVKSVVGNVHASDPTVDFNAGSYLEIKVSGSGGLTADAFDQDGTKYTVAVANATAFTDGTGGDITFTLTCTNGTAVITLTATGDYTATDFSEGGTIKLNFTANGGTTAANAAGAGGDVSYALGNSQVGSALTFQIGANGTNDQRVNLNVGQMNARNLGIADSQVDTIAHANASIDLLDTAINTVSSQRASLGALQNRLEHTLNSLGVSIENLTAAESTIRDTDMASEMMKFTQNSILVQASQAMLAQANALPQGILSLLG